MFYRYRVYFVNIRYNGISCRIIIYVVFYRFITFYVLKRKEEREWDFGIWDGDIWEGVDEVGNFDFLGYFEFFLLVE